MGKVDGIIDEAVEQIEQIPQIEVEVDVAAARRYGITPGHVRRQSSALLASEEVADIFHGGKAYDVHVWTQPEFRDSFSESRTCRSTRPAETRCASTRRRRTNQAGCQHYQARGQTRRVDASADVAGRDLGLRCRRRP